MKKLLFVLVIIFAVVIAAWVNDRGGLFSGEDTEEPSVVTIEENEDSTDTTLNPEEVAESPETPAATEDGSGLVVTSLKDNTAVTRTGRQVVWGDTPSGTESIQVNDYQLQYYKPGDTRWNFIADKRFSNLKQGENLYVVRAFNANGDEIGRTEFAVAYTPVAAPNLPGVGSSLWIALMLSGIVSAGYWNNQKSYAKIG